MKVVNWLLAAMFAWFAYVQINDPDPFWWVVLYIGVAVHFMLAAMNRLYRPAVWIWLAGAGLWCASLAPDFWHWLQMGSPSIVSTMKAETPWVELTREFLGLALAGAACGWLLWKTKPAAR
jgi:hypothetical protein